MAFEEIELTDIELAPFTAFDKGWGLVTAGDAKEYNMSSRIFSSAARAASR